MFQTAYQNIYSFWVRIAGIGITDDLSFSEKKKTQLLNVVVASGIPINAIFGITNFFEGKLLLAGINLSLFLGGILILVINSRRKYLLARVIMTFIANLLFTASAVFYRNGTEHYLLVNLLVIIIYFTDTKYLIAISIVTCLLFVGVKIFLTTPYVYSTMPLGRIIFNISWAMLIMVLALMYFKKEQLAYQEQIEEKNKELEKLNGEKQKLFSIISHDLRSPIGQLKNSLDLVNKEYISADTFKKISANLSSEVDQLHSTLDNLLKWSISQFQGIKAVPEKIALTDTIKELTPLFKQLIENKNISLNIKDVDFSVFADPDHLMLILRNLVSNAIKYSQQDGVITILAKETAVRNIVIEIADNGIGMDAETQASVFSSTYMVSHTGTSNEKGTGLGLKLCKEFIDKNNGQIWVESFEEKGTTFYISLPAAN
jgi:two-component system sensor histidine kinase/response regulator